ncbi:MAG: ASPIC/UnbV domain-containing protein, partial [Acidobacteriota bacterium]
GVLFFDYDLDGRLDILQVNGHLETQIAEVDPSQSYEQPSQLFWNAGPDARATFIPIDVAEAGALAEPLVGRGSAYGDLDGDGDLDLVLTQVGRRAIVLRNDQQLGHGALRVQLADPTTPANRDALGAWLELETTDGVVQRRPVLVTRSYQSQSELPVTFGLGPVDDPAARPIAALRVVWPDGATQSVEPAAWQTLGAGETLVVTRAADGA